MKSINVNGTEYKISEFTLGELLDATKFTKELAIRRINEEMESGLITTDMGMKLIMDMKKNPAESYEEMSGDLEVIAYHLYLRIKSNSNLTFDDVKEFPVSVLQDAAESVFDVGDSDEETTEKKNH